MSITTFHRNFKAVTMLTPLEYRLGWHIDRLCALGLASSRARRLRSADNP